MITPIMPTYGRMDLTFDHGNGARLTTSGGDEYLDFGGGIAVNVLGHGHPHLIEALNQQAQKLWHVSNLYQNPRW